MDIIIYDPSNGPDVWLQGLRERLPQARIRPWTPGDDGHADYALAWNPPAAMLRGRTGLKAVFNLGAGVDVILKALRENPGMMPENVPLFRLEDAGMARQMREYATYMVLGWYRHFEDYREQQKAKRWKSIFPGARQNFIVGVMGAGILGSAVAQALLAWDFPVRCWSRSPKNIPDVASYAGTAQLDAFLAGTRVLINLLPATPETTGILNSRLFSRLEKGAHILNIARGAHLVEADLLAALASGQVKSAALDVFGTEPLPEEHPFWTHPKVTVTPHVAALTLPDETMDRLAADILTVASGGTPGGKVDIARGY
ncbi:2-ketoacid reductase [uncultured delta proteobacterium]|uniref:2-ketoacid reductase n=1 Tax=uncultured delta proteobacterium TaxID=34034 RepID=A0A212IXU6_9DELT|nr:2-ketoacid reductase [uncultured delta proteobacterium]